MKTALAFYFLTIFIFEVHALPLHKIEGTQLIYGNDDRYEIYEYPDNSFIDKAQSVAMRVPSRRLLEDRDDSSLINFQARKLSQLMPLICSDEKYIDQYSVGDCSGFLVAPNILVTAGHCMKSESECSKNKWIFGYTKGINQFQKSDVYSCKKIIAQKLNYNESEVNDYAVVELDRSVESRVPLSRRHMGTVLPNTALVVIGHPMGLPMKAVNGGRVTLFNDKEMLNPLKSIFLRANYFNANLDVYAGNSGSPVFNQNTGKVEGILIQGAEDFIYDEEQKCMKSKHLSNSHHNSYEKVMRITKVPGI